MNKKWNSYPSLNQTKEDDKLKRSNEYSSAHKIHPLNKSRNELEYLKFEKEKDRHTCSI